MEGILVIVGILMFIVGIYIGSYYLNAKVDAPEDAPEVSCGSCKSTTCTVRRKSGPIDKEACEIEILQ